MGFSEHLIPYRIRSYAILRKTLDTLRDDVICPEKTPDTFQVPVPLKAWKFESSSGQVANSLCYKELTKYPVPNNGRAYQFYEPLFDTCSILF